MSLISVIMPAYNAEKFISEAIDSLMDQTYTNWELLIVNDGSTDNTEAIVKEYSNSRIRCFKKENGGVSSARNLALKEMKGDYFCFLDADDTFPINALESRLKPFQENKNLLFVDGVVSIKNSDLSEVLRKYTPKTVENPIDEFCKLNSEVFFGPSWTIKRIPHKTYKLSEDLTHGEDYFFYLENLAESNKIEVVKEPILNYRTGTSSAMTNLKGLEKGYRSIAEKMQTLAHISEENRHTFKAKTKSIMFKSYLGNRKILDALRVLFTW